MKGSPTGGLFFSGYFHHPHLVIPYLIRNLIIIEARFLLSQE